MNQAIKMGKQLLDEQVQIHPTSAIEHMNNLKPAINNLLHQYLPGDTSLDDVETIAMVFNDIIWNPKKFISAVKSESPECAKTEETE